MMTEQADDGVKETRTRTGLGKVKDETSRYLGCLLRL